MHDPGEQIWRSDLLERWPAAWPFCAVRMPGGWLLGKPEPARVIADAPEAWRAIAGLERAAGGIGGWLVLLSYDAGRALEPAAAHGGGARDDRGWPACVLVRVDAGLVIGPGGVRQFGEGVLGGLAPKPVVQPWRAGAPGGSERRAEYERAAGRAIEYIRAGDVYQVNLAHRLSASFEGSARGLFGSLVDAAGPLHGGYVEFDHGGRRFAAASASPELYLSVDAVRGVVRTMPMKGTRPLASAERELRDSEKDRAELAMIVDLMRNDLGRVCSLGSVRVETPREISRHGAEGTGVWQATATVSGVLRPGLGVADALAASFPPGSVTGAPKVRAMQIIDELEPVRRGPYCGTLGYIGDDGKSVFNVAIRTAAVIGQPGPSPGEVKSGMLDYSVGAGIVADSEPGAEWEETIAKAGALVGALRGGGTRAGPVELRSSFPQ